MITIPKSLKFVRNKDDEARLLKDARAKLAASQRSPGIHASDLLDPRKTYFRYKTGDKEAALTDRDVMIFTVGKVLHAMILGAEDEGSVHNDDADFDYSVDYIDDGIPTELKSTRMAVPDDRKKLNQYIEQVLIYMASMGSVHGKLWVLFLNHKDETYMTTPVFRCANIKVGKKDLKSLQDELKTTTAQLKASLVSTEPEPWRELPLCRKDWCSRAKCEYFDECKPEDRWKPKRVMKPRAKFVDTETEW